MIGTFSTPGSIQDGDGWLNANLDSYYLWAQTHNSLLIVTWDEDDGTANNRIPTLFAGPMIVPGQYSETINHFNVLRTIEDMYRLPYAGAAADVPTITDVFTSSVPAPPGAEIVIAGALSLIGYGWLRLLNLGRR